MPNTVSIEEAAELMHTNRKTVEDLIHSCVIPAARIGRKYVMLTKDVMDYVENQIIAQTAERMRRPTITDARGRPRLGVSK